MFSIVDRGEEANISADLIVADPGWSSQASLRPECVADPSYVGTRAGGCWSGTMRLEEGKLFKYTVATSNDDMMGTRFTVCVSALANCAVEGVFMALRFPAQDFAGGRLEMRRPGHSASALFPDKPKHPPDLCSGPVSDIMCASADGRLKFSATVDREVNAFAQDDRAWNIESYSVLLQLAPAGELPAGKTASLDVAFRLSAERPATLVTIEVKPEQMLGLWEGFGGNFVFQTESPVTEYALRNLETAFARTQATLAEWEPENDDGDPCRINWASFEARDAAGSNLRREFELAGRIDRMGMTRILSVWRLPDWLCETNPGGWGAWRTARVARNMEEELDECIVSYLLYAKRKYGAEPDLFSFNESREGIYVLMDAEEYRALTRRLGAKFRAAGLRTRFVIGDTATPRDAGQYLGPTLSDRRAMRYAGALAFHSWGGASDQDYEQWHQIAGRFGLRLMVTEGGLNPDAWRTPWMLESFCYALRQMELYQDIIRLCAPSSILEWELSGDYPLGVIRKAPDGSTAVGPTSRFHLLRHYANLTPKGSRIATCESDRSTVRATAFLKGNTCVIHVLNSGASCMGVVTGLKRYGPRFAAFVTSQESACDHRGDLVRGRDGTLRIELPARSMTTLTTAK